MEEGYGVSCLRLIFTEGIITSHACRTLELKSLDIFRRLQPVTFKNTPNPPRPRYVSTEISFAACILERKCFTNYKVPPNDEVKVFVIHVKGPF